MGFPSPLLHCAPTLRLVLTNACGRGMLGASKARLMKANAGLPRVLLLESSVSETSSYKKVDYSEAPLL